ncbi:MAG: TPM domain-containing protein [Clostridia bacterium]|nr:TPM domain-containing protein [Clostridia bacterium]
MVKRWCLLLLTLLLPLTATADSKHVFDDCGLLNWKTETTLEELILQVEQEYQMTVVVLVDRYGVSEERNGVPHAGYGDFRFMRNFYKTHAVYCDEEQSGLFCRFDIENNDVWIFTYGKMEEILWRRRYALEAKGQELLEESVMVAALGVLRQLPEEIDEGIKEKEAKAVKEMLKRLETAGMTFADSINWFTWGEVLVSIALGFGAAMMLLRKIRHTYELEDGVYFYDCDANSTMELQSTEQVLLHETVTERPRSR